MTKPVNYLLRLLIVASLACVLQSCTALSDEPTQTATAASTAAETSTTTVAVTPTPESSPPVQIPAVPTISINTQYALSMSNECRAVVDGLHDLKKDLGLPEHFMSENPFRQSSDFNPNDYFQVFPHLDITAGYTLDYIYFNDELGGLPLVYARKSNTSPFRSYSEMLNSFSQEVEGERSYMQLRHKYDFLEQIQIDKTAESYFEFISLAFLGDQFYLFWHGLYNDSIILCDPSDIQFVDAELQGFDIEFTQDVKDRIENIDFTPVVIIDESEVTVRFVTFTKWGGFYENVYVMDKDDPIQLIDAIFNPLIEYDCGILF